MLAMFATQPRWRHKSWTLGKVPKVASLFSDSWGKKSSAYNTLIVQAFYHEKSVNLPLIAKEGFLTVFGPGTCPL